MPHTYMRTSLARSGLHSVFSPVSELCILSMGLEKAARPLRRHELEQRRQFGTVQLTGQGDPERLEELRPRASAAFFEDFGQLFEVRRILIEGRDGRGEK